MPLPYLLLLQLCQGSFGVIEDALELFEGSVDWGRGGQVNTGVAQLIQRVSAAAHGEELLVALDGRLALFEDALGQGHGGGVAGGVLVDVERTVEVRDACPLFL